MVSVGRPRFLRGLFLLGWNFAGELAGLGEKVRACWRRGELEKLRDTFPLGCWWCHIWGAADVLINRLRFELIDGAAVRMARSEEQGPEGAAGDGPGASADAGRVGLGRTAFEEIFVAHYGRVVGILRRVVGDAGRAEELASEVFLKLYRLGEVGSDWGGTSPATGTDAAPRVAQFPSQADSLGQRSASAPNDGGFARASGDNRGGNLAGWLYRTATNLGIDALRAGARRARFEQDAARDGGGRVAAAEDGYARTLRWERQRRVRAILGEMKVAQAQLLFLRAEGFSYKELAEAVGVEASSVGTLLVRAEAAFAGRYRELFGEEDV